MARYRGYYIPFREINARLLPVLPKLLNEWLPGGKVVAGEYVTLNSTRSDKRPGSFKINLRTGKWADFATGDAGGDIISLLAYLNGCSQSRAAKQLQVRLRCL